jgi:uncharacterized membrane protein YgcG
MFAAGGMGGSKKEVKGFGGFEGFGTTTAPTTTAAAPAVSTTMAAPTTPPPATAPSGNTTPPANATTPPSVIKPKIQFATSANPLAATAAFSTGSTTGGAVGAAALVTLGKKGVLGSGKPKNLFGQPTAATPAVVGFGASTAATPAVVGFGAATLPPPQQLQQPQQPNLVAMLTEFYQHVGETGKCDPQHIQKALNKYKGHETKMFMKMIKKYKGRIQSPYEATLKQQLHALLQNNTMNSLAANPPNTLLATPNKAYNAFGGGNTNANALGGGNTNAFSGGGGGGGGGSNMNQRLLSFYQGR